MAAVWASPTILPRAAPGPPRGRTMAAGDAAQQRPVSSGQVDTGSYLAGSWCGVMGGATSSSVYSVFMYYLEEIEKMTKNESIVVLVRGFESRRYNIKIKEYLI